MYAIPTPGDEKARELADNIIEAPPVLDFLSPYRLRIPCRFLAYHCAEFLERDVDKPYNPEKHVTVKYPLMPDTIL